MAKILHPKVKIETADYYAQRFHIDLAQSPVPVSLADLFAPSFWAHRLNKFSEGDLIRVIGAQREFDIMVVVASKAPGGLIVETWPRPTPGSPEWGDLMRSVGVVETLTKTELATELSPPAEPASTPKKRAAA